MTTQIFRFLKAPDYISLAGLVLALISIFQSLKGRLAMAALFIYLSTTADLFDGVVARRTPRDGDFGKVLDSLCDVALYMIAMVIFGYSAGLTSPLALVVFVLFVITGVARLARFTIMGTVDDCYVGLPVSYTLTIPIVYFILALLRVDVRYLLLLYSVIAVMMISSIKFRKFKPDSRRPVK